MNKIALVTGASSGIGWATSIALSSAGYDLIICGRRVDRLEALSAKLKTKSHRLIFDVRDREAVLKAIDSLPKEWQNIDVLLNNAGNAHGHSSIQEGNLDDWDAMIDINVKGLLYVTKAIVPGMVKRGTGHVINLGSVAGKEAYPNGGASEPRSRHCGRHGRNGHGDRSAADRGLGWDVTRLSCWSFRLDTVRLDFPVSRWPCWQGNRSCSMCMSGHRPVRESTRSL